MKKILITLVAIVLVSAFFVGCAQSAPTSGDDSLQKIKDKGEIIMGLDDSFPPMGFVDENGELTGFDVELAKAVAKQMGINLKLQPIDWKAKEMELGNGNIDVIWNGYTITDERIEKVLMSPPYMENAQVIVVKADSPIATFADLSGKKIGVQDGSSAQDALSANEALLKSFSEVIDYKDNVTALMDVASGQTDGIAVDLVVAEYYLSKRDGEFKILEEHLAPEEYGIGFRKGEQSFHDEVMKAITELQKSGEAKEISTKWFGRDVTKAMV